MEGGGEDTKESRGTTTPTPTPTTGGDESESRGVSGEEGAGSVVGRVAGAESTAVRAARSRDLTPPAEAALRARSSMMAA